MADDGLEILEEKVKKPSYVLDQLVEQAWEMRSQEYYQRGRMETFLEEQNLIKSDEEYILKRIMVKKIDEAGSKLLYEQLAIDKMNDLKTEINETKQENTKLKAQLAALKYKYKKLKKEKSKKIPCACQDGEETDEC